MPTSKKRASAPRRAANRPPRTSAPPSPEQALSVATLALYQASLQIVREAEVRIMQAARAGEDAAHELDVHHYLRTAALGMLVAYSKLEGLPEPRLAQETPTES